MCTARVCARIVPASVRRRGHCSAPNLTEQHARACRFIDAGTARAIRAHHMRAFTSCEHIPNLAGSADSNAACLARAAASLLSFTL
eukprot:2769342-Rhodomonas_salina.2